MKTVKHITIVVALSILSFMAAKLSVGSDIRGWWEILSAVAGSLVFLAFLFTLVERDWSN